jgi:hypothetical protein
MFDFFVLTYNHEKYVTECLESIKYQILTYRISEPTITILDDHSTDLTTFIVNKWLIFNSKIFFKTKLLINKINQGVVFNYIQAVNLINCNFYKIIAGDDLFFSNSLLDIFTSHDFISTPVISFNSSLRFNFNPRLQNKISNKFKVKLLLHFRSPFPAPGIFMSKELIQNTSLIKFLSNFQWIEDLPTWLFIFRINKYLYKRVNYLAKNIPYVMYRNDVGIWGNKVSLTKSKKSMLREEKLIYKNYKIYFRFYNFMNKIYKYINPLNYFNKLINLVTNDHIILDYGKIIQIEAEKHYKSIKLHSDFFLNNLFKNNL